LNGRKTSTEEAIDTMPRPNAYAVIWDMDGTLVDTAELHFKAWVALAHELNKPFTRADFAATFGRRNPEILRQVFDPNATDGEVADLGARKEEIYKAQARQGVELLPGVRPLMENLHATGFKQAIGSSAPRGNLDLILQLTHIEPLLEAIVSMEDTQRGKPDPQVFLVAAAKLGVAPPRCVVVEDAVAGVEAGKAGGMKCIGVTFVGHHPAERLTAAGADLVVKTLEEVSVQTVRHILGAR
jgi:beta-phosphoglucomutase